MRIPAVVFMLALSAAAIAMQDKPGAPPDSEREKDAYRIYSQMLNGLSRPRFLISRKTNFPVPWQSTCADPPPDRRDEFAEVIADMNARKNAMRTLERKFTLNSPYELLSGGEFLRQHGSEPMMEPANHFYKLADIYFSRNGRLALTGLMEECGGLCGQGSWRLFEKTPAGDWRELKWVHCFIAA